MLWVLWGNRLLSLGELALGNNASQLCCRGEGGACLVVCLCRCIGIMEGKSNKVLIIFPKSFFTIYHESLSRWEYTLLIESPSTLWAALRFFPYVTLKKFLLILSPSCLASCAHTLSPISAIVIALCTMVVGGNRELDVMFEGLVMSMVDSRCSRLAGKKRERSRVLLVYKSFTRTTNCEGVYHTPQADFQNTFPQQHTERQYSNRHIFGIDLYERSHMPQFSVLNLFFLWGFRAWNISPSV